MKLKNYSLVALAILLYTAWNASDLISTWRRAPLEHYSWICFLIWVTPLVCYRILPHLRKPHDHLYSPLLLFGALITSFLGVIGSVNAAQHLAFAFALAAFIPWSWEIAPWLITALSWMPALSWFGNRFFSEHLLMIRFLIAGTGTGVWVVTRFLTTSRTIRT